MKVHWITHKGKKILYIDCRGAETEEDMLNVMYEVVDVFKNTTGMLSTIANFEGTYVTKRFMEEMKKNGKEYFSKRTEKGALIGIKGVKNILYNAYLTFTNDKVTKLFDKEEDALDWLAK